MVALRGDVGARRLKGHETDSIFSLGRVEVEVHGILE
jgi:hypothetical protein